MQKNKESRSPKSGGSSIAKATTLYQKIARHLRWCITHGSLDDRVILTEYGLSRIFNISRTPVRQALAQLERERLIRRRSSSGYTVGTSIDGPARKLTADMVRLPPETAFIHPVEEWQSVYEKIESEIVRQSILSKCRLNAQLLAIDYGCSRSTIQEILHKLEVSGLVERHYQSKWTIVPLDDKRLRAIFDVRSWLEPNLLAQAIPHIPKDMLQKVIERHKNGLSRFPDTTGAELNQLELDMHDRLLQCANNSVAMAALKTTRAGLISSKHIVASKEIPLDSNEPFLREHIDILEAVERRNTDECKLRMQAHLLKSHKKVRDRLRTFRRVVQDNPAEFVKPWAT